MASSKDYEKIWESYQEVIKTKDVSIVDYCQRNGIVYSQFQRWYKKHVSGVSIVPVSDSDVQTEPAPMIPPESSPSQHSSVHLNTQFDGLNDREIVVTGDTIFVLSNSPICSFMSNLIESGAEENTLDIVGHLFSQIILESITGDDTSLDKYLNSDDNYLKSELYTIFTKDELKAVARNCGRKVVNIRKYYRYGY